MQEVEISYPETALFVIDKYNRKTKSLPPALAPQASRDMQVDGSPCGIA